MAMGLYTSIPGFARWHEDCQGWLATMLPLIGVLLGLLWWGIAEAAHALLPQLLAAVCVTLAIPLLTGFLHLDGYMDVSDALLSRRPREDKLRILKDPHTGAFAVISLLALFLLLLGAADGLLSGGLPLAAIIFLPIVSRSLAGWAMMSLTPISQSGYGRMSYEAATKGRRVFTLACLILSTACAFVFRWQSGVACIIAACAFALACWRAVRALGGMNGDVAGWSICWAEVAGLLALACLR